MLLCELTGVKHLYNKTRHEVEQLLNAKGIECIGSGKFGSVFTHKSWDYVLKIVDNDPHYLAFVDWAMKHPSPHFPRFAKKPLRMHSFYKREQKSNNFFWVIKIEKLYPITDRNLMAFVVHNIELFSEAAWHKHHGRKADAKIHTLTLPDGTIEKNTTWQSVFDRYPWVESLGVTYSEFWEAEAGAPDIHEGNIMQRKDGTIVLVDPVWEGETPYQAYDKWIKVELDMVYDHDPVMVTGPAYLSKNNIVKKIADDFLDDIPF